MRGRRRDLLPVAWAVMSNSARTGTDGDRLWSEVEVLLRRLGRWTAGSWTVRVAGRTRADTVFALVQCLADVAADAEGRPRRAVPRRDEQLFHDQLTVVAHDVLRTGSPAAWLAGLAAVHEARATLFG